MRKTSIWARAAAAIFCAIAIVVAPMAPVAQAKSAQEIFAAVAAGVVVVFALDEAGEQIGQGSGVVVGENEVVTNCHVVADARAVAVRQAADSRGRQTYLMDAQMAARDEERDLCLLFVGELSEPPAAIPTAAGRARDLSIGEEVFAVGAPRGLDLSLTRGIVSQLRGDFGKKSAPVIQTDAAISPGSSGGGLFNKDGKLVGITAFKHSGEDSEGLSFAVPAEWVAELQAQAEKEIADERKRQKCLSSPTVDCLFEIALQTAEKTGVYRSIPLHGIAAAQAEAGLFPDALQTAEKIKYETRRVAALRDIAAAFAKAGHSIDAKKTFANALRTAEKIEDTKYHADALRRIATAFTNAGYDIDAKNTLANALRITKKIEDTGYRAAVLREIAVAFAEAGIFSNALRTAEKIEDAYHLAPALRDIAAAQAEAGLFPNALRTAEKIENAFERASTLGDIAVAFAEADLFPDALRIAEKIEIADYRASALSDIAAAFAKAGHSIDAKNTFANALQTAEKIEIADYRASALSDIAAAFAKAGHSIDAKNTFANALQTVEKIEDAPTRASPLHGIATAQAEAGFFPDALRTVEKIESAFFRDRTLRDIAVAQAEAEDIKNAIETSAKIDDESDFAVALARIAVALAKTR